MQPPRWLAIRACCPSPTLASVRANSIIQNVFGEVIELPIYIPAIDWGVIAIILGSSIFVDVVSKSGPLHLDRDQAHASASKRRPHVNLLAYVLA